MKPDTTRTEKVMRNRASQRRVTKGLRRRTNASGKVPHSIENRSNWDVLDELDSEHDVIDDMDVDQYHQPNAPAPAARRRIEQMLEEKWLNDVLNDFPDN